MKKMRKIFAVAIVLCLMVGLMPMAAFADEMEGQEGAPAAAPEVQQEVVIETQVEPVAETQPEPVAGTQPEPVAGTQPEPVAEVKSEAVAEVKSEAVVEVKSEAVAEVKSEAVAEVKSEAVAEVKPEAVAEVKSEAVVEAKSEVVTENEPEAAPAEKTADAGVPQAPEAFSQTAPEAPVAPVEPDLNGLSDEAANEKIRAYNEEVSRYNEAVEQYNASFDAYQAAAEEYNASVENFNAKAESYNAKADEHNKAEQEKLDAYNAAMEEYNQKAGKYNDYQKKIDTVSERNLAKAEDQEKTLGDISRLDKESILSLGTVLEEDYTVKYGRRTSTLGKAGDLVISWDALAPNSDHSTIQVLQGAESGETYKVANLHIFEDFKDFSEMNDYQSENGWDCMNINVDDANGVIIIPKALIDRIAMIEIDVAEVGKNDTVTVLGQNNIFTSNYVTTVGRFFEGYSDGPYWYSAGSVFQSTAMDSESDWTGTGHTFSYANGTTDRGEIKNPLNVNHYVFARYTNPNVLPEKPEEVTADMMDKAESRSFIQVLGSKLSRLLGLPEREIKKDVDPAPVQPEPVDPVIPEVPVKPADPVIPEVPVEPADPETPEVPAEPVVPQTDPVVPVIIDEIRDNPAPLAIPVPAEEEHEEIESPMNIAAEDIEEEMIPLVHYEFEDVIPEEAVPQASGAAWALVNLIAMLLTVLLTLVSLVKRHENEEHETETRLRLGLLIPAAASVVTFFLTENLRNPMVLTDSWTILMLLILALNAIFCFFSSRHKEENVQA